MGLDVPRGLTAIGYKSEDNEELVNGTLPQRRVLDLARELLALPISLSLKVRADVSDHSRLQGQRWKGGAVEDHRAC